MHKGKKIVLLPLTPVEIVQCEKKLVENKKNEHTLDSSKTPNEQSSGIKLKECVLLATTFALAETDVMLNHVMI